MVVFLSEAEHIILADWLGVEPHCQTSDLLSSDALEILGFSGRANAYSEEDAAVAAIVLERIQDQLPQWSSLEFTENKGTVITLSREVTGRRAKRTVELIPKHLMTINWADSGPGFSWPVAYHVTWVPLYEQYIVTQSADCPDAFGYCDFAIGHFPRTQDVVAMSANQIQDDWEWQRDQLCQSRWSRFLSGGLIDKASSIKMRDHVWADEYR